MILPDDPNESAQQADVALAALHAGNLDAPDYRAQLRTLAARYPTALSICAALGECSESSDVIAAYAFFRTGGRPGPVLEFIPTAHEEESEPRGSDCRKRCGSHGQETRECKVKN